MVYSTPSGAPYKQADTLYLAQHAHHDVRQGGEIRCHDFGAITADELWTG